MCWDEDRAGSREWPSGRCSSSWPLHCRPAAPKEPEPSAAASPVCDTWPGGSGTRPDGQETKRRHV